MKPVLLVCLVMLWLPDGQVWGQETDSLFFDDEVLNKPSLENMNVARARALRQFAPAAPFMTASVHFTSDFFKRLYDQSASGPSQHNRIRALFDREDPRLGQQPAGAKSTYSVLVDQFILDACINIGSAIPSDPNDNLYAEVQVGAIWANGEHVLKLYLKKIRKNQQWAWEIMGADADFLTLADTLVGALVSRDSLAFIPPNAHELNFMSLSKQWRSGSDLSEFVQDGSRSDKRLLAMSHYLATGQLGLQSVQHTILWLDTRLGWQLQIRQFNRETDNSGWLISDLCRSDRVGCLPRILTDFITKNRTASKP